MVDSDLAADLFQPVDHQFAVVQGHSAVHHTCPVDQIGACQCCGKGDGEASQQCLRGDENSGLSGKTILPYRHVL